jgi:hypothetical protein
MKKTRAVSFKKEQTRNDRLRVSDSSFGNKTEYMQQGEQKLENIEENEPNKTQVHFVQSNKNGGRRRGQGRQNSEVQLKN